MNYAMATKSRAKATLLAQFLGPFGAHKFYLGRTLPGVLYLLFCWTGIPSIIALIETIIMVSLSDHEFALRHDPGAASLYPASPVSPAGKKRSTAALFAMFLGAFGGHHFYLKRTMRGLIYLALFLLGLVLVVVSLVVVSSGKNGIGMALIIGGYVIMFVPVILGFIDYIRLVLKKDADFLAEQGGSAYSAPSPAYPQVSDYAAAGAFAPVLPASAPYSPAWEQAPAGDPFLGKAETVAFQAPAPGPNLIKPEISPAPAVPGMPLSPDIPVLAPVPAPPAAPAPPVVPGITGSPGMQEERPVPPAPPAPAAPAAGPPQFFDNSYMPQSDTTPEAESYVPGDDNFHPSVLQIPEANPATQMGAAAGRPEMGDGADMNKADSVPRPCLKSLDGEYAGNFIEMDGREICMGRDPNSCQLVFSQDSPFVSGRHCVISYNPDEDVYYLQDLSSTNGTFLMNDEKLAPGKFYTLKDGDGFYLGDRGTLFQVGKC